MLERTDREKIPFEALDFHTFDAFETDELRSELWSEAELPLSEQETWTYWDPNTTITTGRGFTEISVNPFSRSHDSVQLADNPKTLLTSTPVEIDKNLTIETTLSAQGEDNEPEDIWDAFVTLNLFDFESGIVLDFLANDRYTYALYERLYMPGVTDESDWFSRYAHLDTRSEPESDVPVLLHYDRVHDVAEWYIDRELVYRATEVPVKVDSFNVGMGVMTLKPPVSHFPYYSQKSASNHGQGMTGRWGKMRLVRN